MRTHADPKLDLLARVPLFASLPKQDLERISAVAEVVDVDCGRDLTREGTLAHEAFVLLEGGAAVHRDGEIVESLEAGDAFGEVAVLADGRRSATVTTTAPSRVLAFAAHDFRRLVRETPLVAARLLPQVARLASA